MKNTSNNNQAAKNIKVVGEKHAIYIKWNEEYQEYRIFNQHRDEWWANLSDAIDSAKSELRELGDTYRYTA